MKRLLRYLKGTLYYRMKLSHSTDIYLMAYLDADWANNPDDRKSAGGCAVYFGPNLVSCKQQNNKLLFVQALSLNTELWRL